MVGFFGCCLTCLGAEVFDLDKAALIYIIKEINNN
jgi:hypothetical protein